MAVFKQSTKADSWLKLCRAWALKIPLKLVDHDCSKRVMDGHTNAKALAILEVKDAVIQRLEDELLKAEVEVGHYEELAQQAESRAALATQTQIEATKGELLTLRSANVETHDFTESDCEALAEMAEQAERRAWRAEEEVASLKAESQDAKHKVEFLTDELAASIATNPPSSPSPTPSQRVKDVKA